MAPLSGLGDVLATQTRNTGEGREAASFSSGVLSGGAPGSDLGCRDQDGQPQPVDLEATLTENRWEGKGA